MNNVQIVLVKSDMGASKKGASQGADAIQNAANDKHSELFKANKVFEINQTELEYSTVQQDSWAKNIDQIRLLCERITILLSNNQKSDTFWLLLSGDHSTAAGTLAGIKKSVREDELGVVWIDAHADLHSPYTTPSGNLHGMPLAATLGLDNLRLRRNNISENAVKAWEEMKNLGGIKPKIKAQHLVYVGLRQMEEEEEQLIQELQIPVVTVKDLRMLGAKRTASTILKSLENCKHIAISFDVDSLDPEISKATGTPVAEGLTRIEATELLESLCADNRVLCLEIVEINPLLEPGNTMGEIGFEIADNITKIIKKRNNAY